MNKLLLTLICTFCIIYAGVAQTNTPTDKPSPPKGAVCLVDFDASGHVKTAVMTQSTGSKVLDDEMVASIRNVLPGPPNKIITIPVMCLSVEVSTQHGKSIVRVAGLRPPYPAIARIRNEQGSGLVTASFDKSGNVVNAIMAKSTGSQVLDHYTVTFVMSCWKSSGIEKVTTSFPIAYRIR